MQNTSGNNPSNIPEDLKKESFMLWRLEKREGRYTKPPINTNTGLRGDVTDRSQWTDYENALEIHQSGRFHTSGISVVLHPESELVGLDLDHCINDGAFSDDAREILKKVCSYSEISPSGNGVRIFLYGKLPEKGRRRGPIECYDEGRHLTVTGNHIHGTPKVINRDQTVIDWFHQKFIASPQAEDSPQMEIRDIPDETGMILDTPPSDVSILQIN